MLIISTEINMPGIKGNAVTGFFLNCSDEDYQHWWPGMHMAFHTLRRCPDDIGNLVWFDEFVGKRRLRFKGMVTRNIPGREITWQMVKVFRLPVRLTLKIRDAQDGIVVTHMLSAGFKGVGKVFDPFLKLFFSKSFELEMNMHAQTEFSKLAEIQATLSCRV